MTDDWQNEEIRMREKAQAHAGEVNEGAGSRGTPRRMAQMVSVRLSGSLIRRLRTLARRKGVTLSDLLREGAELVLERQHIEETRTYIRSIEGASEQRTHIRPEEEVYTVR
jgi:predicted DNA-binding protein